MPKTQIIQVGEAKGRPMLHWVGKRPLERVTAYPAQLVETFNPTGAGLEGGGLLFHGDNRDMLAWLLANGYRGKVDLIYIDPPFDSGADYVRQVQLRGARTRKLSGEAHSLGEQVQYTDIWANDMYLQFMYERLLLLKELLAESGSFYLHCDWHKSHHLRSLLDEVFGSEKIRNEIIWQRTSARSDSSTFNHIHDTLFFYAKGATFHWNEMRVPHAVDYIEQFFTKQELDGRQYQAIDLTAPGTRNGETGKAWRGVDPNTRGRHWSYPPSVLDELDAQGKIYWPDRHGGMPRLKQYLDELEGRPLQTIWTDINVISSHALEREDYPTQKPESLLERIISASSNPGDLVLDCFCGSGTTPAVAQKLGRRWIAADINKGAIQTTSKRLQTIIWEQAAAQATPQQLSLTTAQPDTPPPAALAFSVYRVNDYDLQIQHNEAVALVIEHLGIERKKTDAFFDGLLGQRLVKVIPFNHPLSPLDLQLVKDELAIRPDEERDVAIVCLGKELAVDAWLEEYNRHRPVNRIEVIELRTDQRYGNFLMHQPAEAEVAITRQGAEIIVEIGAFISPTIAQRLEIDTPLLKVKIPDWRAMVDCVMIDAAYNGEVFNIVLSDVPERKADLVVGRYELPAPEGETTVAVKIIDMLGEEVLVVRQV